jgi:hypothetical protein
MATIKPEINEIGRWTYVAIWRGMASGDDAEPIKLAGSNDRTAQVIGTFGGASVSIDGSLEIYPATATNFATLTDPQGLALTFTASKVEAITELTNLIKPTLTGGGGSTLVDVYLLVRGGD